MIAPTGVHPIVGRKGGQLRPGTVGIPDGVKIVVEQVACDADHLGRQAVDLPHQCLQPLLRAHRPQMQVGHQHHPQTLFRAVFQRNVIRQVGEGFCVDKAVGHRAQGQKQSRRGGQEPGVLGQGMDQLQQHHRQIGQQKEQKQIDKNAHPVTARQAEEVFDPIRHRQHGPGKAQHQKGGEGDPKHCRGKTGQTGRKLPQPGA